jgi:hypothetical protein
MSLYRITTDKLEPVSRTTFAAESLLERKDLQRLLRRDITPIADDLMVIAEEYGEWEDSNRRPFRLPMKSLRRWRNTASGRTVTAASTSFV